MRLAVFDVDGTLVDSQSQIMAAMTAGFAAMGLTLPPRPEVLGIVGLSLPVAMARLMPDLADADHHRLAEAYRTAWRDQQVQGVAPQLYPGARDALEALARRDDVVLGIATGKSRKGLDALIKAQGWDGLFVTSQVADDHPSKPHPSMLLTALAQTGIDARDAVMIGDTEFDMDMGRAASIGTVAVTWGYHPPERLRADETIGGFPELPAALDRLWGRAPVQA